jgi:hypothetical protein
VTARRGARTRRAKKLEVGRILSLLECEWIPGNVFDSPIRRELTGKNSRGRNWVYLISLGAEGATVILF